METQCYTVGRRTSRPCVGDPVESVEGSSTNSEAGVRTPVKGSSWRVQRSKTRAKMDSVNALETVIYNDRKFKSHEALSDGI